MTTADSRRRIGKTDNRELTRSLVVRYGVFAVVPPQKRKPSLGNERRLVIEVCDGRFMEDYFAASLA